jgi:hypothetical protein
MPIKLCLVAAVFHVPCPGCGLTRAAFALARGDLGAAYSLHPMSLVVIPFVTIVIGAHAVKYVRTGRAWTDARLSRATELLFAATALLLVAVWVARLYGFFGGPVAV